jgi:hypothetical protein
VFVIAGTSLLAGCESNAAVFSGSSSDALETRVLAFAQAAVGRTIGTGQCAELADQALTAAGANTFSDYAAHTDGDDYVWGTRVALQDARPGDIIQFRDYSVTVTARSGIDESTTDWEWAHHTAIVEQNVGIALLILEQNVDGSQTVKRGRVAIKPTERDGPVRTSTVIEGRLTAYRPTAGPV